MPGQNLEVPPPYVLSYEFEGQPAHSRIDHLTRTIAVEVPATVKVTALVARFAVFKPGSRVFIGDQEQTSGRTANDFTFPRTYRITSPDGSSNTWTVRVERAAPVKSR